MANHHFHRRHPAHCPAYQRHNAPVILLLTLCTKDRRPVLATEPVRESLVALWSEADHRTVGYYLIMPDHIHLFCSPATTGVTTVNGWTAYWKRRAGRRLPVLKGVFQADCWDRQMRDGTHYGRKLDYVSRNPLRAGLVGNPIEWPYQGHLAELNWIGGP